MALHPLFLTHIDGPTSLLEFGTLRLIADPTFDHRQTTI
jgi:hypothetical protein